MGPQALLDSEASLEPHTSDELRIEFYRPNLTMLGRGIINTWFGLWLGASTLSELADAVAAGQPLHAFRFNRGWFVRGFGPAFTEVPCGVCQFLLQQLPIGAPMRAPTS